MDKSQIRILYVEDDLNLSMVVEDFLLMQGFQIQHFSNAEMVVKQWNQIQANICLLDIMLPQMDGFELAKFIRSKNPQIPIIFLSAKNQTKDKIQGLEIGADDYITKPFSTIELSLRIQAIMNRIPYEELESEKAKINISLGSINYQEAEMMLITPNESFTLTRKENQLIKKLIENRNEILKRDDLLTEIWGENNYQNSRSMDVYLSKIRKMIAIETRIAIVNYHGTGFKLETNLE